MPTTNGRPSGRQGKTRALRAVWPNPSLEWTATGKPLGPRAGQYHHSSHGPSAFPASATSAQTLGLTQPTFMRFRPLILVSITLLSLRPAEAASWQDIAGNSQVTVEIDIESMRSNAGRVRTWLIWHWPEEQEIPGPYPAKTFRTEKQPQVSDCKANSFAMAQGVRYADADGVKLVDSYEIEQKNWQFTEAVPDSIGATIVRFACKPPKKLK
jgi:hypothetical protein